MIPGHALALDELQSDALGRLLAEALADAVELRAGARVAVDELHRDALDDLELAVACTTRFSTVRWYPSIAPHDELNDREIRITTDNRSDAGVHDGDLIREQRSEPLPVVRVLCSRDGVNQRSRLHPSRVPRPCQRRKPSTQSMTSALTRSRIVVGLPEITKR